MNSLCQRRGRNEPIQVPRSQGPDSFWLGSRIRIRRIKTGADLVDLAEYLVVKPSKFIFQPHVVRGNLVTGSLV